MVSSEMKGVGSDLVREARKRAGLTQRELAERLGTTQSAIARVENRRSTPSFDTVFRAVRACGLDLDLMLVERDDHDWTLARPLLALTPAQRAERSDRQRALMYELRAAGRARRASA